MKIAISADKKDRSSEISSLSGRAPYYLIFDENGELLEEFSNPFVEDRRGAGVSTAKMLAEKNIDTVISGTFGGKMAEVLESEGIKYYEKKGFVEDALKDVLNKN